MCIVPTDFSKFRYREFKKAVELLECYNTGKYMCLLFSDEGVSIMLNTQSRFVFLTNSDFQVAGINDNNVLADFLTCPDCGYEGFIEDFDRKTASKCCKAYIDSVRAFL